jgi:hypothetical protein
MLLTALMGVSLGLLGGGGSILAVPILVYVFGVGAHPAIAMSLVLVGATAFAAALMHHRNGCVDWKSGMVFAVFAAPVSLLGAAAAMRVRGEVLLVLFGSLMLVGGTAMIFRREIPPPEPNQRRIVAVVVCGAGVGFLTGFLGVGGGFLIVPALVLFLGKEMKQAIGTSLLVIALNSAVAVYGHRSALHMQWNVILPAAGAALAGMVVGSLISKRVPSAALRKAFGVLVGALGALMVARNVPILLL